MGKDIHYLVLNFCRDKILNHHAVDSYEDISNENYYKFRLKRKNGLRDVIVLYDDNYHFGEIALLEAIAELPEGGIVLIPRPESSIGNMNPPDSNVDIYVNKIGPVMGALHIDKFWTYVKKKKRKEDNRS